MSSQGEHDTGIDIGTGGTRAVLLYPSGCVAGSAAAEYAPMTSPQIGWAEQDPRDWWRTKCHAIQECLKNQEHLRPKLAGRTQRADA
ncbi:MAG: FGGY family carbohydrate kinase [Acidobacteriaceae bacterium]